MNNKLNQQEIERLHSVAGLLANANIIYAASLGHAIDYVELSRDSYVIAEAMILEGKRYDKKYGYAD